MCSEYPPAVAIVQPSQAMFILPNLSRRIPWTRFLDRVECSRAHSPPSIDCCDLEILAHFSGPGVYRQNPHSRFPSASVLAYSAWMRASRRSVVEVDPVGKSLPGTLAIGIFLFFGAIMASLAATTLLWPGTILDRMWTLNAPAYTRLAPLGKAVGIPFLVLGVGLAVAGTGWFKRSVWGWGLAVVIIAIQVLGDLVNLFMGDFVRGGAGATIAGALLFYLLSPRVRAAFRTSGISAGP